jgi:hypothetical protein
MAARGAGHEVPGGGLQRPHPALRGRRSPIRSTTPTCWSRCVAAFACTARRSTFSTVLAGQRVGIKEVDEGIWLVSFLQYDLGSIDLEQRTLQPIDNPFGPRLSPMS